MQVVSISGHPTARPLHETAFYHSYNRSHSSGIVFRIPRGRPSPKLAINVDPDVHRRVMQAAAEDQVSISAWMPNAARAALTIRDGLSAIAEWGAENGTLTEAELTDARGRVGAQLGLST